MTGIRVAIVDDHQSILDGYQLRLSQNPSIVIVGTIMYGDEIQPFLTSQPIDILLLDISIPTSPFNATSYPVLQMLPEWVENYPTMRIVVVSMHGGKSLLARAVKMGVSGYILKEDHRSIQNLSTVIERIAQGYSYFSESLLPLLQTGHTDGPLLTSRQMEVLALCAAHPNETTAQLADRLVVAPSTLRNLLSGLYTKLGINNRTAAVARAKELGILL